MWLSDGGEPSSCRALMEIGQTGTFVDPRDSSSYSIARLADGNCWMIQNLRIINKQISSSDSTMISGSFTIPASSISNFKFSSSDFNGDYNQLYSNDAVYYDGNPDHGAYYTWHTAIAGTSETELIQATSLNSICPKEWRLPFKSEYAELYNKYPDYVQMTASPIPHFIPFGYISSVSPTLDNTKNSFYWSATALSSSNAYDLLLMPTSTKTQIRVDDSSSRYYGGFVRCVAENDKTKKVIIRKDSSIKSIIAVLSDGKTFGINDDNEITLLANENSDITISAIPKENYKFIQWYSDNKSNIVSNENAQVSNLTVNEDGIIEAKAELGQNKYIQDITVSDCSNNIANVTDKRDGNSYAISKLSDGKCWMLQNLRLGSNNSISLTTNDSDASFTLSPSNPNGYTNESYTKNWVFVDPIYGGFYNWYTATAGQGDNYFANQNSSNWSDEDDNIYTTRSICPKGWRLPTRIESKNITDLYGDNNLWKAPTNKYGSELFYGGTPPSSKNKVYGSSGLYFWTSVPEGCNVKSEARSCYTYYGFGNSSIGVTHGAAVRCVLR